MLNAGMTDVEIHGNRIVSATTAGVWGNAGIFDDVRITDNSLYSVDFHEGTTGDRTNFMLARNLFDRYIESTFASVHCRDNTFKTIATYGRAMISVLKGSGGAMHDTDHGGELTFFADGDTSPSVLGRTDFCANQSAPVSITTFDDAAVGKIIRIYCNNGNMTLVASSTLKLPGGVNFTGTAGDSIVLRRVFDVGIGDMGWVTESASVN
jgi:hypothetical protein